MKAKLSLTTPYATRCTTKSIACNQNNYVSLLKSRVSNNDKYRPCKPRRTRKQRKRKTSEDGSRGMMPQQESKNPFFFFLLSLSGLICITGINLFTTDCTCRLVCWLQKPVRFSRMLFTHLIDFSHLLSCVRCGGAL